MMLCCFLLLTSAGIANSVRRDTIRGKAVTLLSNTDIGINDKEVTLYINESTLIATWTWKNGPIETVNMNLDYMGRIDMDIKKNIWIFEVDVTDAGKYWIKCIGTDKVIEVELNILEKNLTLEEIKIWLDDHQGFIEKYLGNLTDEVGKEVSKWLEDHPGFFQKFFDINFGTEEAITEGQGSHNTKIVREKGPQADHCAYCRNRNNAMFVLPCEHEGTWYIPTCTKCGISPKPPCQKCRAPNRRYMEYALWKDVSDPALTKFFWLKWILFLAIHKINKNSKAVTLK